MALASPRAPTLCDRCPARTNPLPRPADLTVPSLALSRANIAILLNHHPHPLPQAIAIGKAVHRAKNVVAEIGKEEEGVVIAVFEGKLFLVRKTLEDLVDKAWDQGGEGAVGLVAALTIEDGEKRED